MMSISTIAPAFAASPWKDLWSCINDDRSIAEGTLAFVTGQGDCEGFEPTQAICVTRSGVDGHVHFFDKDEDGERQAGDKQRCVRDHPN